MTPPGARPPQGGRPVPDRRGLGVHAERLAADHLLAHGYRILTRNYRTRGGELDLVAQDGDTIVFVEVRARTRADLGEPFETIGPTKQRRVARAAETWLVAHGATRAPARFDVVSILLAPGAAPAIELIQNAFET
ncbi:MAG TPA: YraN family protein [Polyangia bacterium]